MRTRNSVPTFGIILCIVGLVSAQVFLDKYNETEKLSYVEFTEMVKDNKVEKINYQHGGSKFNFTIDDQRYEVSNPRSNDFKENLLLQGVEIDEFKPFDISDYVPLISIAATGCLMFFLMRKMMPNSNKDSPKTASTDTGVLLKDVVGAPEMKKDVSFLIRFLKEPKMFSSKGAKMPKGILLYGEPGTGKTMLAKAIAGEAGVPFFSATGSDFVEMYVGVGASRIRKLFKDARACAPSIIFIDEIDAIGSSRGGEGGNSESRNTINALLTEMDGYSGLEGVLIIASTNRISDLDPALLRSGRFDKHIKVPLPMTKEERLQIINIHKGNKPFADDCDLMEIARITTGFSGADIANLLNEAVIVSIVAGKDAVEMEDVNEALLKLIVKGHKKESLSAKDKESRELVAYHEAGHALLSKLLTNESVNRVTVIGTTTGAGGLTLTSSEESMVATKSELEAKVMVYYGGRIAEELSGREASTGASNDLEMATKILSYMYTELAMSENYILSIKGLGKNPMDMPGAIDKINNHGLELYDKAKSILSKNMDILDAIKDELIEKETIEEQELDQIIEDTKNKRVVANT